MDITQLRYFLETAETLNYTKAAEKLFLSRQALRQALAAMEKELGMPLFVNERNKLSLTPQGEYLRLSAKTVVNTFDEMLDDVKRFAEGEPTIRMALSVSLFPFILPEIDGILKRFQQKYPQIQVILEHKTNDEVIQAVTENSVDCGGVIQMTCDRPGIQKQSLAKYTALMSIGERHRELADTTITLEELVQYPCIGMGNLDQTMKPLYEDCQKKGLTLNYQIVPHTIDAFYQVSHGDVMGFDIVMDEVPSMGKVYGCFLDGYTWEVCMLYPEKAGTRKEIQLFGEFLEEEYQRIRNQKRYL